MTMDGEAGGAFTPRNDMVADILETPRGRREWQEFKASADRVHMRDHMVLLEERCKALEEERKSLFVGHEDEKQRLLLEVD